MKSRIIIPTIFMIAALATPAASQTDELATVATPTIDEVLAGSTAPRDIRERLIVVAVDYYTVQDEMRRGYIVVDSSLRADIDTVFAYARQIRYPIEMVVPIRFDLPGNGSSMSNLNNSYAFHYRNKVGIRGSLSVHSYGRAIDINPYNNPYVSASGKVIPQGAVIDPADPRTLSASHPLVLKFEELGWTWGGSWTEPKDYMHFEKPSTRSAPPTSSADK